MEKLTDKLGLTVFGGGFNHNLWENIVNSWETYKIMNEIADKLNIIRSKISIQPLYEEFKT